MTPLFTPWGHPDHVEEIAPGIVSYSTPSHGGYWLSPERVAEMPKPLREFKPWAGPGWFEEDCDWAVVALAFPQYFPEDAIPHALRTLERYKPELFAEMVALLNEQGRHVYSIHYADREFARSHDDPTLGVILAASKEEAESLARKDGDIAQRVAPCASLWATEIKPNAKEKTR